MEALSWNVAKFSIDDEGSAGSIRFNSVQIIQNGSLSGLARKRKRVCRANYDEWGYGLPSKFRVIYRHALAVDVNFIAKKHFSKSVSIQSTLGPSAILSEQFGHKKGLLLERDGPCTNEQIVCRGIAGIFRCNLERNGKSLVTPFQWPDDFSSDSNPWALCYLKCSIESLIGFYESLPLPKGDEADGDCCHGSNQAVYRFEKLDYAAKPPREPERYGLGPIQHTAQFWIGFCIAICGGMLAFAGIGGESLILFLVGCGVLAIGAYVNSTSADRRSENVRILPIVVAELEFRNVQRHVLGAHLVERAHYSALEDRPEAFDCLSVDRTYDVLSFGMVDHGMRVFLVEFSVAEPLIGAEQAYFVRDSFADEFTERISADVLNNAGDHIALALNHTDDRRFSGTNAARSATFAALVFVLVLRQFTNESFVNLDNAAKLVNVLHQCDANFVTHAPSGLVRTEAHVTINLKRAHALFAGQYEMDHAVPIAERLVRVLEDRSDQNREPIAVRGALVALPMPFARSKVIDCRIAATRAVDALRPAPGLQIGPASIFVGEHALKLSGSKLVDLPDARPGGMT
jgi:hypothetical protein